MKSLKKQVKIQPPKKVRITREEALKRVSFPETHGEINCRYQRKYLLSSLIQSESIQRAREAGGILVAPGVSPGNSQSNDPMSREGATDIIIKITIVPFFCRPLRGLIYF